MRKPKGTSFGSNRYQRLSKIEPATPGININIDATGVIFLLVLLFTGASLGNSFQSMLTTAISGNTATAGVSNEREQCSN